jgi:hypothetical protein
MGVIPPAVSHLVLWCAFGLYTLMGFVFFVMGLVYMGDAGTVGATGMYLILLGVLMMIVGAIALLANHKKTWLLLFLIELVNVALFLVRLASLQACIWGRGVGEGGGRGEASGTALGVTLICLCAAGSVQHDRRRNDDGNGYSRSGP